MKTYEKVVVLEGHLSNLMNGYVIEFRAGGSGFEDIEDESIIFALLEYSRHPRPYTPEKRIKYIYEKACDFENKPYSGVRVEIDDLYGYFTILFKDNKTYNIYE